MHEDDTYYYNERNSPGLEARPLEPPPALLPTKTRSVPDPSRPSAIASGGRTQSTASERAGVRKTSHLSNPGEPILMHYFAPNNPELQREKHCECEEPCNCSASPTDSSDGPPAKLGSPMTTKHDTSQYTPKSARDSPVSRTSAKAGIARKAQDAFQSSKEAIVSKLKSGSDDTSDGDAMRDSRRSSRSRSKALQERKRSSQLNVNTLKDDLESSAKRPRTAESNLRSTAGLGLSPILQPHMIKEQHVVGDETLQSCTLAPMSADSPSETQTMASPASIISLPPLEPIIRRSRTASYSSTTGNGNSLRPPHSSFLRQQTSSSSTDGTPIPSGPGPMTSSRYLANGQAMERRIPRSRAPPELHKYGSSTTSITSVASAPGLSATESTSPEGLTPSTMATPGSNNDLSSDQPPDVEVSPHTMPANYVQVTHPIADFKCTFDGCSAPPFPTPYTLSSHAKKHSQERPYFCPEAGCKRSEGGLDGTGGSGFKRKNEMVRHGLVHKTPGYACPWCVEGHKNYPRPDNLLRHARDQHKDKDVGDSELRYILDRRIGPAQPRGRKKRA